MAEEGRLEDGFRVEDLTYRARYLAPSTGRMRCAKAVAFYGPDSIRPLLLRHPKLSKADWIVLKALALFCLAIPRPNGYLVVYLDTRPPHRIMCLHIDVGGGGARVTVQI